MDGQVLYGLKDEKEIRTVFIIMRPMSFQIKRKLNDHSCRLHKLTVVSTSVCQKLMLSLFNGIAIINFFQTNHEVLAQNHPSGMNFELENKLI